MGEGAHSKVYKVKSPGRKSAFEWVLTIPCRLGASFDGKPASSLLGDSQGGMGESGVLPVMKGSLLKGRGDPRVLQWSKRMVFLKETLGCLPLLPPFCIIETQHSIGMASPFGDGGIDSLDENIRPIMDLSISGLQRVLSKYEFIYQ